MIQAVARCVYHHRQWYATLANTRVSTHDYATYTCFSSFFRRFEIGFIVSIKWCSLQARRAGSRRFQYSSRNSYLNICGRVERQNSPRFAGIMPSRETRCVCSNAWWRYNFFSLSLFFLVSFCFPSKWISFARESGLFIYFFFRVWSSGYTLKRCVNWGEWEFLCRVFVGCS